MIVDARRIATLRTNGASWPAIAKTPRRRSRHSTAHTHNEVILGRAIVKKKETLLVNFYAGVGCDNRGRVLSVIQRWSDEELERTHDYIQWLFPLTEQSAFNSHAPILDVETIREFRVRPELRENLRASLVRMLAFFGFRLLEDEPFRVVPAADFAERAQNWLTPANHNHLRITRILKSLRLLGLEEEAAALFRCLEGLHGKESRATRPRISEETFRYWRSALR
jgi:hypothetical protein